MKTATTIIIINIHPLIIISNKVPVTLARILIKTARIIVVKAKTASIIPIINYIN